MGGPALGFLFFVLCADRQIDREDPYGPESFNCQLLEGARRQEGDGLGAPTFDTEPSEQLERPACSVPRTLHPLGTV